MKLRRVQNVEFVKLFKYMFTPAAHIAYKDTFLFSWLTKTGLTTESSFLLTHTHTHTHLTALQVINKMMQKLCKNPPETKTADEAIDG